MKKTTNTTDDFDLNKWFAEMSAKSPFIAIPAEDCEKCEIERLKKIIEETGRILRLAALNLKLHSLAGKMRQRPLLVRLTWKI